MCDHLAVELPTEPQSTAPSVTGTKGAILPTMTQPTVQRDQSQTMCDHLAVAEDRLQQTEHHTRKRRQPTYTEITFHLELRYEKTP